MDIRCKKCNSDNLFTEKKNIHTGIYCNDCGAFIKWGTKEEIRVINEPNKALKKQIPQKPTIEGDSYYNGELMCDTWRCPNCEKSYELYYDDYKYCPNCGQHIDWSDFK